MINYFVSKGVPIDTVFIVAGVLIFEVYALVMCRKDICKWAMGITSTAWTMALRSWKKRRKDPARPAHKQVD